MGRCGGLKTTEKPAGFLGSGEVLQSGGREGGGGPVGALCPSERYLLIFRCLWSKDQCGRKCEVLEEVQYQVHGLDHGPVGWMVG